MRLHVVKIFLPALLLAASPSRALAAPRTFQELAEYLVYLMNSGISVLIILGLVIYFSGIVSNLHKAGEKDSAQLRTYALWGVVIIFVMVSVWGILALVRNTIFGGGATQVLSGTGDSASSGFCTTPDCTD